MLLGPIVAPPTAGDGAPRTVAPLWEPPAAAARAELTAPSLGISALPGRGLVAEPSGRPFLAAGIAGASATPPAWSCAGLAKVPATAALAAPAMGLVEDTAEWVGGPDIAPARTGLPADVTMQVLLDDGWHDSLPREVLRQQRLGAQSKRGAAPQHQLEVLKHDRHAIRCFGKLAENEERLCGEWAVFYHTYCCAALIYEVHAAVAAVLFGFPSHMATLPRLLVNDFAQTPDASSLIRRFNREFASKKKDHQPEYRKVAISAMCSLVALGPEGSTPLMFVVGYSEKDLSFPGILHNLLQCCYVPDKDINKLAESIIALCETYDLDVSQFGGKKCSSGKTGHLLQIFIKRQLLDEFVYAAKPYGEVDHARHPISKWLNSDAKTNFGQARIVAHPKAFLSETCVQMHVVSADFRFHSRRLRFQQELTNLLCEILGDKATRERAAFSISGHV